MGKPSKRDFGPPWLFKKLLAWFCESELKEELEGDLEESYLLNLKGKSNIYASYKYAIEVLFLIRPSIIKKRNNNNSNTLSMYKNYTKVGLRNILKYKVFSFINIFGLAVAMSVCLLIILMLADQHQYDKFHTKKDRIYRILTAHSDGNTTAATTPFSTLEAFNADYQLAETSTMLRRGVGGDAVYENNLSEMIGYFADPNFFTVFSFSLSKGDPSTALERPNSMVISEQVAYKLFGTDNPIGKMVDFTNRGLDFDEDESSSPSFWGSYTITGVIPIQNHKTHLRFDVLISNSTLSSLYQQGNVRDLSESWSNYYQTYNYIVLNEGQSAVDLAMALKNFSSSKFSELEAMKGSYLIPQSILDFRPGPLLNNAPSISLPMFVYYVLSFLALIVLILACLNYTNLSIARAITRAKEIGVRKVTGARRKDIILQFLSESIITALLALLLANVILFFVKSAFMNLWLNQYLNFDLTTSVSTYVVFLVFAILLGLIAGIFPALGISKQHPVTAMKGLSWAGNDRISIRKILTVFQFTFSLLFIITSIVIYNQFRHFMEFDYGFESENVVSVNMQSNEYENVKKAFSSIPGVLKVSGSDYLPSTGRTENIAFKNENSEEVNSIIAISATSEFIDVLDFKVIAGDLKQQSLSPDGLTMIVNREASKLLGYEMPAEIIGESFETSAGNYMKVIGVIEDFTFHLLFNGQSNSSVLIHNVPQQFTLVNTSINTANRTQILDEMAIAWKSIDPVHPFAYEFYEDSLASNNKGIFDIVNIVGFIAFLAITIASLGLLGIVIYTTERRTKEVGIRKALGASNNSLAFILSKEFLKLLIIAIFIASPLAYLLNNFWLDFMTVRVGFGVGTILLGSLILLVFGLLAISSQTIKVAGSNPVDVLKYE